MHCRSIKSRTGEEIFFEKMKEEDLPDVLAIERASFTSPWSGPLFRNEISSSLSRQITAKMSGRIIGYICSTLVVDEGNILDIAVHPAFRGQGVASALIEETIENLKLRGCRAIFLEVRISHESALRMYDKFGFKVIGSRKDYYASPPEDASVMVLRLN